MSKDINIKDIPIQDPSDVITTITSLIGFAMDDIDIGVDYDLYNSLTLVQVVTHNSTKDGEILNRFIVILN